MYRFVVGLFTGFVIFTDEGKKITNKAIEGITNTLKGSFPLLGILDNNNNTNTKKEETKEEIKENDDNVKGGDLDNANDKREH